MDISSYLVHNHHKMKYLIIIFVLAFWAQDTQGQCPSDFSFTKQIQIDSFPSKYNCGAIMGSITIFGPSITSLDSLYPLNTIGGSCTIASTQIHNLNGIHFSSYGPVNISNNPFLEDLTGMPPHNVVDIINNDALVNLEGIAFTPYSGNLNINDNDGLISTNGLIEFSGAVSIDNNSALKDLGSLSSVEGYLLISHNASLTSLGNLSTVKGDLTISNNASLTHLGNLSVVDDQLKIHQNLSLTNLGHLTKVGHLIISENDSLTNLNGLEELTIQNAFYLEKNKSLVDISSLANIEPVDLGIVLKIADNPLLSECAIASICGFLTVNNQFSEIHNNGTGCNSSMEILEQCTVDNHELSQTTITIAPNPASDYIFISSNDEKILDNILIYNALGQLVLSTKSNTINSSSLPKGIYTVVVKTSIGLKIEKLILE